MTKLTATLAMLALLLAGGFVAYAAQAEDAASETKPGEGIAWQSDVPEDADRPTMLYFTATWCGPCQTMKKEAWGDPEVIAAAASYTPVKVDIDERPEVAGKHEIRGVPTVLLLSKDGKELDRMVGYGPGMQGKVRDFLAKHAG